MFAMDALFGLPRKKSAGKSYRNPLHDEFFCDQSPVDQYVAESDKPKISSQACKLTLKGSLFNCTLFKGVQ